MSSDACRAAWDDWRQLGRVVGQAFAEDPVSRWALGSPAAIEATFTRLGREVYLPRGICHLIEARAGSMWLPPGGSKDLSLFHQVALAWTLSREGGSRQIVRALQVDAAMRNRRPTTPHYYLFAVGVMPERRGQGLARRILQPLLDRADSAGVACWLENSNPRNDSLYGAMGFVPIERFEPAEGCPVITTMRREPGLALQPAIRGNPSNGGMP